MCSFLVLIKASVVCLFHGVYSFSSERTLEFPVFFVFCFFAVMNEAAISVHMEIFMGT